MELDRSQGGGLELEPADKTTIDWEQLFIDQALNFSSDEIKFVPNAVKSFSDVRDITFPLILFMNEPSQKSFPTIFLPENFQPRS